MNARSRCPLRASLAEPENGGLVGASGNPTCTAGPERTATYDLDGNRVAYSTLAAATYDQQDRLITLGTTTYQHSPDGERTKKNAITYTHNAEGQLEKVVNGATTIDYVLDPFGRRVARAKNGTVTHRFLWGSALGPIAEVDASGNVVTRYVYGTRANVPDFMVKGSQVLRLVTDLRGSVRLVVDVATGAVMQHIEYDEWGKQTLNSSPGLQPFGFSGGLSDDETGLVRFGARDYDPEVGRWVTKDPILFNGGMNQYAYSRNDPVNLSDVTGEKPGDAFTSPGAAAEDALRFHYGASKAANVEIGGIIYFDPKNARFYATPGQSGDDSSTDIDQQIPFIPSHCVPAGEYHTHARDSEGQRKDEELSQADKERAHGAAFNNINTGGATRLAALVEQKTRQILGASFAYGSFLATPSGSLLQFYPDQRLLAVSPSVVIGGLLLSTPGRF